MKAELWQKLGAEGIQDTVSGWFERFVCVCVHMCVCEGP